MNNTFSKIMCGVCGVVISLHLLDGHPVDHIHNEAYEDYGIRLEVRGATNTLVVSSISASASASPSISASPSSSVSASASASPSPEDDELNS